MLAIFAISLTALLLAGALAFDGGIVFVERRDQQNAADAAALAGARFLTSNTETARTRARDAAYGVAQDNGFEHGVSAASVHVHVPPDTGPHQGQAGYIEVQIAATRPSVFAGLAGILDWDIGARAVALNGDGAGGDFAILALDPEDCRALQVTGTGSVAAHGHIQVNSTCGAGALNVGGQGVINVNTDYACNVVGPPPNSIDEDGGGKVFCTRNMGASEMADPLSALCVPYYDPDAPAECLEGNYTDVPSPLGMQQVIPGVMAGSPPVPVDPADGVDVPDGCPGGDDEASWASPELCRFQGNRYEGTAWVIHPGLYAGGLDLSAGTFYFRPGIYFVAGGGINIGGLDATARSLDESGRLVSADLDEPPDSTHGVMLYNTEHPDVAWDDVRLNGGYADFQLLPLHYPRDDVPTSNYNGIIVFNDRDFPSDPDLSSITLNGGGSNFEVRGTVYSASGLVTVNGNSDEFDFTMDQVIANTYKLNGNGGSITALNDTDFIFKLRAAGLVE